MKELVEIGKSALIVNLESQKAKINFSKVLFSQKKIRRGHKRRLILQMQ